VTVTAVFSLIAVAEMGSWEPASVFLTFSVFAEHPEKTAGHNIRDAASIEKVQRVINFFADI
jgi:hypothetical protein